MEQVKNYLIYFVSILFLFIFLFFSIRMFEKKEHILELKAYEKLKEYENISINEESINISYPKFNYRVLDEKIEKFIGGYKDKSNVSIEYSINISKPIITMFFTVREENSVSFNNINYSIRDNKFVGNEYLIDFNVLGSEILDVVKKKYSTYIYEKILEDNFKSTYVNITENGMFLYFSPSIFEGVEHSVYVFF